MGHVGGINGARPDRECVYISTFSGMCVGLYTCGLLGKTNFVKYKVYFIFVGL